MSAVFEYLRGVECWSEFKDYIEKRLAVARGRDLGKRGINEAGLKLLVISWIQDNPKLAGWKLASEAPCGKRTTNLTLRDQSDTYIVIVELKYIQTCLLSIQGDGAPEQHSAQHLDECGDMVGSAERPQILKLKVREENSKQNSSGSPSGSRRGQRSGSTSSRARTDSLGGKALQGFSTVKDAQRSASRALKEHRSYVKSTLPAFLPGNIVAVVVMGVSRRLVMTVLKTETEQVDTPMPTSHKAQAPVAEGKSRRSLFKKGSK